MPCAPVALLDFNYVRAAVISSSIDRLEPNRLSSLLASMCIWPGHSAWHNSAALMGASSIDLAVTDKNRQIVNRKLWQGKLLPSYLIEKIKKNKEITNRRKRKGEDLRLPMQRNETTKKKKSAQKLSVLNAKWDKFFPCSTVAPIFKIFPSVTGR